MLQLEKPSQQMMQPENQFAEGLVSGQPTNYSSNVAGVDPQRTPNFPPVRARLDRNSFTARCVLARRFQCRPMIYHNMNEMPTESGRKVVKKALYGWFGELHKIAFHFRVAPRRCAVVGAQRCAVAQRHACVLSGLMHGCC
jgi:hypothetical protein